MLGIQAGFASLVGDSLTVYRQKNQNVMVVDLYQACCGRSGYA